MIHHFSIAAHNPEHAASVIAEVLGGQAFAFPPSPGSFIAVVEDGHGTAIEVYPLEVELAPGTGDEALRFDRRANPAEFTATHAALSITLDEARVKEIAAREGWRAVTCDRGGIFQVIEFWVENRMLLELLTPDMARAYLNAMTHQKWSEYLRLGLQ